jgi:hypothetical protein
VSEHATYRIGNAIAVTQRLADGTWLATFPGFTGTGAAESDALVALANEVESAAKRLRFQAHDVAGPNDSEPTTVLVHPYVSQRGDWQGQIINKKTGEILHRCGACISRKDALRDAEQVAQRKGYRVVEVSE